MRLAAVCRSTYGVTPGGSPAFSTAGCQTRCRQLESRTIEPSVAEKIGASGRSATCRSMCTLRSSSTDSGTCTDPDRGRDRRRHARRCHGRVSARSCEGFLYLVKGSMSDPGITASIPIGLPPRSGAQVICWRQFGTYFWTSHGLGWNDDGTPPDCPIRWAARSGTGHDRAGPGRHRWCSRCSVGSPTGPLTPVTGPLASASTVVPSDRQSLCRSRVSGPPRRHLWRRNLDPSQ